MEDNPGEVTAETEKQLAVMEKEVNMFPVNNLKK